MSDEIVYRLLKNRSSSILKESMNLFEADADEEYLDLNDEDIENTDSIDEPEEVEDTEEFDVPSSSIGSSEASTDDEESEEGDVGAEEDSEESPAVDDSDVTVYENPLDNHYAVHYTLGSEVSLNYTGDSTSDSRNGVVDGYDVEGFYRVRWEDGTVTNGLTDIALKELVRNVKECVCGGSEFVNEGAKIVCDRCGRHIREGATLLPTEKDKKRMIRPELHPVSTAVKPSIAEAIKKAFKGSSKINEEYEDLSGDYEVDGMPVNIHKLPDDKYCIHDQHGEHENHDYHSVKSYIEKWKASRVSESFDGDDEEGSVFDRLEDELGNEFWTRQNELQDSIEELGYVVEEINGEYVVVSHPDEEDDAYQIYLGGTSRTFTLDFRRARIV